MEGKRPMPFCYYVRLLTAINLYGGINHVKTKLHFISIEHTAGSPVNPVFFSILTDFIMMVYGKKYF